MAVTRQGIKGFHTNYAPAGASERELPAGFLRFFIPLHGKFAEVWFPGNDGIEAVAAFLAESPKKWQLPTNQLLTVDPA